VQQSDVLSTLSQDILERFQAADRAFWEGLHQKWQESCLAQEPAAARLGEMGWTLPMWGPIHLLYRAAQHSREEVDEGFVAEYRRRWGARFRALSADLLGTPSLSRWHPIIDQCVWAHRRSRFLLVVPSLLAITEGVTAQMAGTLQVRSEPRANASRQVAQKASAHDRLVWVSLHAFLSRTFADSSFGSPAPPVLNRHWILHGRAASDWTEADSLRLFQALHTLTALDRTGWVNRGTA
jgi:hypothetical protein